MKKIIPLLVAALLLPAAVGAQGNPDLPDHLRALYAGDFAKAYASVDLVRVVNVDPRLRFELLMQRIRIQQLARLSGKPDRAEGMALFLLKGQATSMPPALQGEARLVELISTYFQRLTKVEEGDFMSLQPGFNAAAEQIVDPCNKAEAMFFSALMPQMSGKVRDSAGGLEQARAAAVSAGCDLQLSYVLRHLAVVAEEHGDLDKAAQLAQESLALRRRIKFEVFLPYSLLHSADVAQKRGDLKAAQAFRKEALDIAERLKLPAQAEAARAAMGKKG